MGCWHCGDLAYMRLWHPQKQVYFYYSCGWCAKGKERSLYTNLTFSR